MFTCSSDDYLQDSSTALPVAGNVEGQVASEMVGATPTMTVHYLHPAPTDPLSMRNISSGIDLHGRAEEQSTSLQNHDEQLQLIINEDTNTKTGDIEPATVTVDSSSESQLSSQLKRSSSVGTGM